MKVHTSIPSLGPRSVGGSGTDTPSLQSPSSGHYPQSVSLLVRTLYPTFLSTYANCFASALLPF